MIEEIGLWPSIGICILTVVLGALAYVAWLSENYRDGD